MSSPPVSLNRVFEDVIKIFKLRCSHARLTWVLNPVAVKTDTFTHRRKTAM